jgi:8-oxo-dGTP pyrophosphatase MutT (NUDIX family)
MGDINWKDKCWVTTIFLVRPDRKVLLTMNKNLKTWIPVGGHIDPGDTPAEAIIREVEEETGFSFTFFPEADSEEARVAIFHPHHIQTEKVPHHNLHINIVWYGKCTAWSDRKGTDEDEELRWFSEQELVDSKSEFLESVWESALDAVRTVK